MGPTKRKYAPHRASRDRENVFPGDLIEFWAMSAVDRAHFSQNYFGGKP